MDAADNDICEGQLLRDKALFKAALHNTAAMLVRSDLIAISHASLVDELGVGSEGLRTWAVALLRLVRRFESQQEGLDHVVAIRVGRQVKDILRHFGSNCQDLVVQGLGSLAQHFDQGLDCSSTVQIHGDLDKIVEAGVHKLLNSMDRSCLNELLAEIVSKLIGHHLRKDVGHHIHESCGEICDLEGVTRCVLKLLLDHSAT